MVAVRLPGAAAIDPVAPVRDPGVRATPEDFGAGIGASAEHFGASLNTLGAILKQKREEHEDNVAATTFETDYAAKAAQALIDARTRNPNGGDGLLKDATAGLQTAKETTIQSLRDRGIEPSQRALDRIDKHAAGVATHTLPQAVTDGHNLRVTTQQQVLNDGAMGVAQSIQSGQMDLDTGLAELDKKRQAGVGLYNAPDLKATHDKWRQAAIDAAIENRAKAGDKEGAQALRDKYYGSAPTTQTGDAEALAGVASRLGISPRDLAASMSYETGGTFNPNKVGGKGGNFMGLIQFGPEERAKYGVKPGMSFQEQLPAVENFLRDRGIKPGMGLSDIYRTINGGNPNAPLTASDGNGTIADHIGRIQSQHWFASDAEADDCDREDGGDREPEDSGIGDADGVAEQMGGYHGSMHVE